VPDEKDNQKKEMVATVGLVKNKRIRLKTQYTSKEEGCGQIFQEHI
jgi:hypothetical protein